MSPMAASTRSATEQLAALTLAVEQIAELILVTDRDGAIEYVNQAFERASGYGRAEVIGRQPRFLKSGEHDDIVYSRLWATISHGDVYQGSLINRRKDGRSFRESMMIVPIADELGRIARFISIGVDITGRAAQAGPQEDIGIFGILAEIFPGMIYRHAAGGRAAFEFLGEKFTEMTGFSAEELVKPHEFPVNPLMSADDRERRHTEIMQAAAKRRHFSIEYAVRHKSGMIRRFLERGRSVMPSNATSQQVVGLVIDVSEDKSLALRLEQSEEARRGLAAQLISILETERKRIARELHDDIGQNLTSIKMRIEGALSLLRLGQAGGGEEMLTGIVPMIQQTMDEVRRISMDLRPSILDDLGIIATIGWLCRSFGATSPSVKVEADVRVEESEVPEALKIVIYRVLQEAMNNIAKHAHADFIRVRLSRVGSDLELAIEDNGRGFDVAQTLAADSSRRGAGLASMRERLEAIGGRLSIQSAERIGTVVQAILPCTT